MNNRYLPTCLFYSQPKLIDDNLSAVVECVCSAIKIIALVMNSDSMPYTQLRMYNNDKDNQNQRYVSTKFFMAFFLNILFLSYS